MSFVSSPARFVATLSYLVLVASAATACSAPSDQTGVTDDKVISHPNDLPQLAWAKITDVGFSLGQNDYELTLPANAPMGNYLRATLPESCGLLSGDVTFSDARGPLAMTMVNLEFVPGGLRAYFHTNDDRPIVATKLSAQLGAPAGLCWLTLEAAFGYEVPPPPALADQADCANVVQIIETSLPADRVKVDSLFTLPAEAKPALCQIELSYESAEEKTRIIQEFAAIGATLVGSTTLQVPTTNASGRIVQVPVVMIPAFLR